MESTDIAVIGSGPGGYTAAFYAADKGRRVLLVEREPRVGGVCLNHGCIPSKALLHATQLIPDASASALRGIEFVPPRVELQKLRAWKSALLEKLGDGIVALAKNRAVEIVQGQARFEDSRMLHIATADGERRVSFSQAIVATGSEAVLPRAFAIGSGRVMTAREALALEEMPASLLVVGGGYIGMELGTVFARLGSRVTVVEALDSILAGADSDLARPVLRAAEKAFHEIRPSTSVTGLIAEGDRIRVTMESAGQRREEFYDRVLVAVGRAPNCDGLGLEHTRVARDERGFIRVNERQQTADPAIYAVGDVVGPPLLAHKAAHDARVAVEAILGQPRADGEIVIPAVVYTDPELAWCGLSETEARQKGIVVKVARFAWAASGKALTQDRPDGLTKLIIEPQSERVLGVGIVGPHAGELIAEGALAVQLGIRARAIAQVVHPHPTLSETLMECAEIFYGQSTYFAPRKKRSDH